LTSGVNFTNILHKALCLQIPKALKDIHNLTVIFALLGSMPVKLHLSMLSSGVNLLAAFRHAYLKNANKD
jgi:hypothetical protein